MRNFKEILLFLLIFSAILALDALFERFGDTYALYPHDGRAIPPKPPSGWKEHTWVTAGADG